MKESETLHNIAANARSCGHHENLCAAIKRSAERVRKIEASRYDLLQAAGKVLRADTHHGLRIEPEMEDALNELRAAHMENGE